MSLKLSHDPPGGKEEIGQEKPGLPPLAGPPVDHDQAHIGKQPYSLGRPGIPQGQEQGPGEAQGDAGRSHATALRRFSIEAGPLAILKPGVAC